METRIGKIQSFRCGLGGYQDAMLGFSVSLGSDKEGWGVTDFRGTWGPGVDSNHAKWSEHDRSKHYDEAMRWVGDLLIQAKRDSIERLVGIPVEVTFDGNTLTSWRVLTEAI